jgi:hypothetical protein
VAISPLLARVMSLLLPCRLGFGMRARAERARCCAADGSSSGGKGDATLRAGKKESRSLVRV